jgi:hypothetical protein
LQKLGLQEGDRVAILSLNSDRYLEYQMAVPWAGGVLNPCNIRWSAAEILYSLDDSGSTILLVDETFRPMVEQFRGDSRTLREVIYCGDGAVPAGMHGYEALLAAAEPGPDVARRGEDLAGIFYTGGTTGFPKGVMLSHTNMCSSGLALRAEGLATPAASTCHAAPMFHLADMGLAMPHWFEGNTHAIVPAFNPEARPRHHRALPGHPCSLRAHHDPDDGGPSDHAEAARPQLAQVHRVRCFADLRSRARACHGRLARRGLHAGLRHDRTVAAGYRQPGLLPHGRGPQARQAARRRAGRLLHRAAASSTPRATRCRAARSARSRCAART